MGAIRTSWPVETCWPWALVVSVVGRAWVGEPDPGDGDSVQASAAL